MKTKKMSTGKKLIIGLVIAAVIFAAVIGIIYAVIILNRGSVIVIPVSDVDYGTGGYYANNVDGTVSMGSSQTLSSTSDQPIAELYVNTGDRVTKGQAVAKYSTTAYEQQLSQHQLDVQSAQIRLNSANEQLNELNQAVEKPISEIYGETDDMDDSEDDEFDEDEEDEEEEDELLDDEDVDESDEEHLSEEENDDESDEETVVEEEKKVTEDGSDEEIEEGFEEDSEEDSEDEYSEDTENMTLFVDPSGNTYTASELRKEKNSLNSEIRSLQTSITEYQNMVESTQKKIADSTVYATMDGVVVTANYDLLDSGVAASEEEEDSEEGDSLAGGYAYGDSDTGAEQDEASTVLKISSYDGVFVNTYISEFNKTKVKLGDTVYINAWETGEVYKATITDISVYVAENYSGYYDENSSSVSYYPMTVRIENDSISLSEGSGVDVSLTKPEDYIDAEYDEEMTDSNIYLYKAFVADEGGVKYAYISKNGKLKKQKLEIEGQEAETYIVTGGITSDDYIAFPYGDNIRVGAKVKKGSIDMLYGD